LIASLKALLLFVLLLSPEFNLGWVTSGDTSRLRASLTGYDAELSQCISSGLSLRFRYDFELCKKRNFWWDDCRDSRTATNSVEFDPISETYAVTSDLLGDSEPPIVERVENVPKALALATSRSDITWNWLSNGAKSSFDDNKQLFRGRVSAECRGEYSESMKRLSYVLSFGLVRSRGYDSGWVEFKR